MIKENIYTNISHDILTGATKISDTQSHKLDIKDHVEIAIYGRASDSFITTKIFEMVKDSWKILKSSKKLYMQATVCPGKRVGGFFFNFF